jgi:branched-chain amino acid transport system ATP-binding protein
VVRTFQNVRLFKEMTAVENLLVAQHRHLNTNFFAGLFKTPASAAANGGHGARAHWLEKVNLTEFANRPGTLAYGQQRRLEIARCMMTRRASHARRTGRRPEPAETEDLKALIGCVSAQRHRAADRARHEAGDEHFRPYRGDQPGHPLADGTPEQIRDNPDVIKAYLGKRKC